MTEQAGGPPPHALLRPRIVLPFVLVALIWGSTWFVITGQIADVPPSWSVTWRFSLATPAMFVLAVATGRSLRLGARGQLLALAMGLTQFCGNFNFVYRAELHLTSGIVAVMFALLIVPNALFARAVLHHPITPRFLVGSAIGLAGVTLLLLHEARVASLGGGVGLGIVLAVGGILSASISNVAQAGPTGRALPLASLLAWAMLYGVIADAALAWWTAGAPVFPDRWQYWAGIGYLALAGSVVTFPLYYALVREIGPGRAAYNGVLVVIVAMLLSTMLEGYRWTPLAVAGAVLGMVGMIVALRARTPVK
jgi:drug/metabolite transporter (DMT)-like permease